MTGAVIAGVLMSFDGFVLRGPLGAPLRRAPFKGHPLAVSPGEPVTVSRASHLKIGDHGISCEVAGRNAFLAPFAYQARP